jgi:hypothetical protein
MKASSFITCKFLNQENLLHVKKGGRFVVWHAHRTEKPKNGHFLSFDLRNGEKMAFSPFWER